MSNTIIVNPNQNIVEPQELNTQITVTDNKTGNSVNLTESTTNIIRVNSIGPQGPKGEAFATGSFATTGSNVFTGTQTISTGVLSASLYTPDGGIDLRTTASVNGSGSIIHLTDTFTSSGAPRISIRTTTSGSRGTHGNISLSGNFPGGQSFANIYADRIAFATGTSQSKADYGNLGFYTENLQLGNRDLTYTEDFDVKYIGGRYSNSSAAQIIHSGSYELSGSLHITGSLFVSASEVNFANLPTSDPGVTGRLFQTASEAIGATSGFQIVLVST